MLLLDNSQYGANEDYTPNRWVSQTQAALLMAHLHRMAGATISVGSCASGVVLLSEFSRDMEVGPFFPFDNNHTEHTRHTHTPPPPQVVRQHIERLRMDRDTSQFVQAVSVAKLASRRFQGKSLLQLKVILFVGSPWTEDLRALDLEAITLDIVSFHPTNQAAFARQQCVSVQIAHVDVALAAANGHCAVCEPLHTMATRSGSRGGRDTGQDASRA